jgi:parallel beta-helix repeat protein
MNSSSQPMYQNRRVSLIVFLGKILLAAMTACATQAAWSTDYYVDGLKGNDNFAGTAKLPFKNVWRAWAVATPGDKIHLLPTVTYSPIYLSGKSGTATASITLMGEGVSPNRTKVSGGGVNMGIMIDAGANYLRIENLDITAPGHGNYSGWSGIFIQNSHNIVVSGNYIHDSGCSGVQTESADYVRVEKNLVVGNAKDTYNNIYCSGISTHENLDFDSNTGFKIYITNNIVHSNTNTKSLMCKAPCTNSDGNGIIIDDSRRTQSDFHAYHGGHMLYNNVIFNNGGRGIDVYRSDNVVMLTNTLYNNNQDPLEGAWRPGEISIAESGNINVYNNILHSDGAAGTTATGAHVSVSVQDNNSGGPIIIDQNVLYNSVNDTSLQTYFRNNLVSVSYGTANKWGNPLFKMPSSDPSVADFRVKIGSPAAGIVSQSWYFPGIDILGVARSSPVTAGAYQVPVQ